jgi:hypothetical protein
MDAWYLNLKTQVAGWLPAVATERPGLYRMSHQALHPWSVDATSLAIDLHLMLGLPLENLQESLAFLDSRQEETTGFYQEEFADELDPSVPRILEMSGTYFGYQVSAVLQAINRAPKFPFRFYEPFLVSGAIERYMAENMPWGRAPMGAGNMVDHGATMMRANARFFDPRYAQVIERMYAWLTELQNPQTGYWGDIAPQGRNGLVQAGYHIMRGLYFHDDRAPAYPERIVDTTLASLAECAVFTDGQGEGCHDMDHFVVLERLLRFTNGYREADIRAACTRRLEQLACMHRPDGGFSFEAGGSIRNHNRYDVTQGLPESDLVGTVFYLETLLRIFAVLGLPCAWSASVTHGVKR